VAHEAKGIEELAAAVERHRAYLEERGLLQSDRRERLRTEVLERARDLMLQRLMRDIEQDGKLDAVLDDLMAHRTDPASAARTLVDGAQAG
jgi:LAO/AO transport system kinase